MIAYDTIKVYYSDGHLMMFFTEVQWLALSPHSMKVPALNLPGIRLYGILDYNMTGRLKHCCFVVGTLDCTNLRGTETS